VRGERHGQQLEEALVARGVGDGDGGREGKGNFAKFSPPGVTEGSEAVTSSWYNFDSEVLIWLND